jgi:S-adenosylmethionine decarboxylase
MVMIQLMAVWVKTDPTFLCDEELLRDMLEELVVKLNMTVLVPTIAVRVPTVNYTDTITGKQPKSTDSGLTLFTVISESHLAIHTWPKIRKAWIEIVSCKPFKEQLVGNILCKYFPGCEILPWR